jgi:hypothetical protein
VLHDADGRAALEVNRFEEVLWFGKEAFTETVAALIAASALVQMAQPQTMPSNTKSVKGGGTAIGSSPLPRLELAAQRAGYRVSALLQELSGQAAG